MIYFSKCVAKNSRLLKNGTIVVVYLLLSLRATIYHLYICNADMKSNLFSGLKRKSGNDRKLVEINTCHAEAATQYKWTKMMLIAMLQNCIIHEQL